MLLSALGCAEGVLVPERFKHRFEGSDHVLSVTGELDIYTAPLFTRELTKSRDKSRLIIDLSECRYIDSSIVAALIVERKESTLPMRLVVAEASMVRRVLEMVHMNQIIPLFANVVDATKP
jgi:anti-anti-sigma factor